MADVTSIYGNPIKDAVARADISTLQTDVQDVKDGLTDLETQITATLITDTASGAIASFPDGADNVPVKSLTVDIEPVQDLHGQANPYPAGGGKNLLHVTAVTQTSNGVTFTVNEDGTVKVNGTATANTYLYLGDSSLSALAEGSYILSGCPSGGAYASYGLQINDGSWRFDYGSGASFTKGSTLTGVAIRIANGYTANNLLFKPMIRLSSVTDATFAPYENICPISGHTQATVTRTGSNLLNPTLLQNKGFSIDDGTFTNNSARVSNVPIQVVGGQNITVSVSSGFQIGSAMVYDGANTYIGAIVAPNWMDVSYTFALPSNARYFTVNTRKSDNSNFLPSEIQMWFNYGSTATAYEPYNGQTYTIDLDGTRYGGSLDVDTGVMTVDRAIVSITSVQGKANTSVNKEYYFTGVQNAIDATKSIISDKYPYNANPNVIYNTNIKAIGVADNGIILLGLGADGPSDMASANTFLSNNPITVCYFLKTPQTVQLTANEISTVLGQNNIWNDCGDTTVEYRADMKLYINKMLNA